MPDGEDARTLHKNLAFTATEQYKLIRANLDFTIPDGEKCSSVQINRDTMANVNRLDIS